MEQRTLKISKPLLLRRILATLIFSGSSGTSGVSILSLNPYLCGLSSGSGEGAGIVGESADRTCAAGSLPSSLPWPRHASAGHDACCLSRALQGTSVRGWFCHRPTIAPSGIPKFTLANFCPRHHDTPKPQPWRSKRRCANLGYTRATHND